MSPQMCAWHHAFNHVISLGPALVLWLTEVSGQGNFYPAGVELPSPVWMCCILSPLPWGLTKPGQNHLRFYSGTPSERANHHFHLHPGISAYLVAHNNTFYALNAMHRMPICPFKAQAGWNQRPFILLPSFSFSHPKAFLPPDTRKLARFGEQTQMTESYKGWNQGSICTEIIICLWKSPFLMVKGTTLRQL